MPLLGPGKTTALNLKGWPSIQRLVTQKYKVDPYTAGVIEETTGIIEKEVFSDSNRILTMKRLELNLPDSPPLPVLKLIYSNDTPNVITQERLAQSLHNTESGIGRLIDRFDQLIADRMNRMNLGSLDLGGLFGYLFYYEGKLFWNLGVHSTFICNSKMRRNSQKTILQNIERQRPPKTGSHINLFFLYTETETDVSLPPSGQTIN